MKVRFARLATAWAAMLAAMLAATAAEPVIPDLAVAVPKSRGETPEALQAALIAGAQVSGRHRVLPGQDLLPAGESLPPCFDARCAERLARRLGRPALLFSELRPAPGGSGNLLVLALYQGGRARALFRRIDNPDGLLAGAKAAAEDLAEGRGEIAEGPWEQIRWLSARDSADHRRPLRYGLLAAVAAAGAFALAQDQWRLDPVSRKPLAGGGLPGGELSSLRGFFAGPPLDARTQGRAGAGATLSSDALAVLLNPAALAGLRDRSLVLARSQAPDGSPRLAAAYASPSYGAWAQGGGLYYAGDGLASEATAAWAAALDLEGIEGRFAGILAGAAAKVYLAQVGEEGAGQDRSRGRTAGLGLDLGLVLPLEERLRLAFALRDAPGWLWHRNDFTDVREAEWLPPEFRAAASARAGDTELFLEGQTALVEDAPVHIRMGGEQALFRILRARGGYHHVFGSESVRRFSLGFGLDTRGLRQSPAMSLHFAFEYGLGEHEALAGARQVSLDFRF